MIERVAAHSPHLTAADLAAVVGNAKQDLEALREARIFITGGTGYIGRWLLESLCYANDEMSLGVEMVVLSRDPDQFSKTFPQLAYNPAISFVKGDIRSFEVAEQHFTHVIHAATDIVASATPLDTFEVTVLGTRRVLEWARKNKVADILLLSSGAVYGQYPNALARIPESFLGAFDVTANDAAYGLGKTVTEWLGNVYTKEYGIQCKSARVFAQVGPYLELGAQFAVGNFVRDVLANQNIVIKGDGTALRTYMYGTDLVIWLLAILVRGASGRTYNVGSEQVVSIYELAKLVAQANNVSLDNIQVLGQPAPGAAPNRYIPDTTRARTELGLTISIPLKEALSRTMAWYRPQFSRDKL
ncbi:MAG: epimerase [Pusillimonas sp.]|nr:epimerase [Pusillimonas sp.]MBC43472.1 epimerase [Pusillimonas sp.]HCP78486.1 epimerase [Pusillimonas sp.]|tara:strand:+ start:48195 stop:49268 length:1074 start_codon:yes stop_codon:yes gene_type:complete